MTTGLCAACLVVVAEGRMVYRVLGRDEGVTFDNLDTYLRCANTSSGGYLGQRNGRVLPVVGCCTVAGTTLCAIHAPEVFTPVKSPWPLQAGPRAGRRCGC